MGIIVSPWVKGIVLWAAASIRRWFLIGGTCLGVSQWRGRYTDVRPLVKALEESPARYWDKEGKETWRRAIAGFTSGGEPTTLSAANIWRWEIRRGIGARQDSTERIPVGVAEKQFVVHLWTLCQKVFRRAMAPAPGDRRSAPESRIGVIRDVASLWHRYGARPAPGGLKGLMRAKAP